MSPWLAYLLGVMTLPAAGLVYVVQHDLRITGREAICDRHGWSSGPMDTTARWKRLLRTRVHAVRHHRHGVRWDDR